MAIDEKIRRLEALDGLEGLIAIADILDDPNARRIVLESFKALGKRGYRERVAGCLLQARAIDDETAEKIESSREGYEIFMLTRAALQGATIKVPDDIKNAISCAGPQCGGYKTMALDLLE